MAASLPWRTRIPFRSASVAALAAGAISCGRSAPTDTAEARRHEAPPRVRIASPTPSPPAIPTASPLPRVPLAAGLRFTLVPNLPGVAYEDVPVATERHVEVLSFNGKRLRLRWSGLVRVERAESARRREDWVRARANAGSNAAPIPPVAADYEDKEVGGTLDFPDFGSGRSVLLPGLWPEGNVTLRGCSAIWIPRVALADLKREGRSRIPFFPPSPLVTHAAAELLHRAVGLVVRETPHVAGTSEPDEWRLTTPSGGVPSRVGGVEGLLPTSTLTSWFGTYEVLADDSNPLVVSVLPAPRSSPVSDLFAPGQVLKTLLGYRVASFEEPGK